MILQFFKSSATVIAAVVVLLDQVTKLLIVHYMQDGAQEDVIAGFFKLVHFRNTGAAWGLLNDSTLLLAILSILVLAFLIYNFKNLVMQFPERYFSISLIAGGIIGNLIDRLARGSVVDFLYFFWHNFHWPAFNVADAAITVGVTIFIISTLFRDDDAKSQNSTK